jgi:hypothetical protein
MYCYLDAPGTAALAALLVQFFAATEIGSTLLLASLLVIVAC